MPSDCTFEIRISVRISKIGSFAAVRGNLNSLARVRRKVTVSDCDCAPDTKPCLFRLALSDAVRRPA